jgi:cell fate regulator YaaT (PSP1 superfamily)
LTYEYETYKKQRKNMPKAGKRIKVDGEQYLVKRQIPLQDAIVVENNGGEDVILTKEQWKLLQPLKKENPEEKEKKRKRGK